MKILPHSQMVALDDIVMGLKGIGILYAELINKGLTHHM